jgi:hypothetical protein
MVKKRLLALLLSVIASLLLASAALVWGEFSPVSAKEAKFESLAQPVTVTPIFGCNNADGRNDPPPYCSNNGTGGSGEPGSHNDYAQAPDIGDANDSCEDGRQVCGAAFAPYCDSSYVIVLGPKGVEYINQKLSTFKYDKSVGKYHSQTKNGFTVWKLDDAGNYQLNHDATDQYGNTKTDTYPLTCLSKQK